MAGAENKRNLRGYGRAMNGWFAGSIEPWSPLEDYDFYSEWDGISLGIFKEKNHIIWFMFLKDDSN